VHPLEAIVAFETVFTSIARPPAIYRVGPFKRYYNESLFLQPLEVIAAGFDEVDHRLEQVLGRNPEAVIWIDDAVRELPASADVEVDTYSSCRK
jgi:hypothetical protein